MNSNKIYYTIYKNNIYKINYIASLLAANKFNLGSKCIGKAATIASGGIWEEIYIQFTGTTQHTITCAIHTA